MSPKRIRLCSNVHGVQVVRGKIFLAFRIRYLCICELKSSGKNGCFFHS